MCKMNYKRALKVVSLSALLLSAACERGPKKVSLSDRSQLRAEISNLLEREREAWNRIDSKGFAQYCTSNSETREKFESGRGYIRKDRPELLEEMIKSVEYPDSERGKISVTTIRVLRENPSSNVVQIVEMRRGFYIENSYVKDGGIHDSNVDILSDSRTYRGK